MPRQVDRDFRTWWAQQIMLISCYKTSLTLDPAEELGSWEGCVMKSMTAGEERNLRFGMTDATTMIAVMKTGYVESENQMLIAKE